MLSRSFSEMCIRDSRYDEIGELLEVPEIYADPKKMRALTREQKELLSLIHIFS